jgi:hypothetical protein
MFPDFLGIGAQKAGTTWLHENLSRHSQIWMPPVKEIHYFDHPPPSLSKRLFGRATHLASARRHLVEALGGLGRAGGREAFFWALRYCFGKRDDDWYCSLFPKLEGKIAGEICPGYCRMDEAAVARLHARMPQAKIIYFLRDPIGRAWSTAVMHFNKRGFPGIERTSDEDIRKHLANPKTLAHADYLSNLEVWCGHFPANQLFIGYFDELSADPRGLLKRVLGFLGVDASDAAIPADVGERRNAGRGEPVPERFLGFLVDFHRDQLEGLNRRFDNPYTRSWLNAAQHRRRPEPPGRSQ